MFNILGKDDNDITDDVDKKGSDDDGEMKPFTMSALKTRAFVTAQRERREVYQNSFGEGTNLDIGAASSAIVGSSSKRGKSNKK